MEDPSERSHGIQVIARAAAVLRILGEHPQGLSLAEIAGHATLARSTVQRIVQALEVEGFVEARGSRNGFQLGPALGRLVYHRQIDIVSAARPHLEKLSAELMETAALCELKGSEVTALDRCIPERLVRVVFPLGTIPIPARRLAPGLAALAQLPQPTLKDYLGAAPSPALVRQLAEVRSTGRAEDSHDECAGFAVPLQSFLGLYSISVIVPAARAHERREHIFARLQACRAAIGQHLGQ